MFYNGTDLTHLVKGNLSDEEEVKRVAFVEVRAAYLVIAGLAVGGQFVSREATVSPQQRPCVISPSPLSFLSGVGQRAGALWMPNGQPNDGAVGPWSLEASPFLLQERRPNRDLAKYRSFLSRNKDKLCEASPVPCPPQATSPEHLRYTWLAFETLQRSWKNLGSPEKVLGGPIMPLDIFGTLLEGLGRPPETSQMASEGVHGTYKLVRGRPDGFPKRQGVQAPSKLVQELPRAPKGIQ